MKSKIMIHNNATLWGIVWNKGFLFGALLLLVSLHGFSLFCINWAVDSITSTLVKIIQTTKNVTFLQTFFCLVSTKLSFGINVSASVFNVFGFSQQGLVLSF